MKPQASHNKDKIVLSISTALVALLGVGACTSYLTQDLPKGQGSPVLLNGLIYYLPEGRIRIIGSFTSAPSSTTSGTKTTTTPDGGGGGPAAPADSHGAVSGGPGAPPLASPPSPPSPPSPDPSPESSETKQTQTYSITISTDIVPDIAARKSLTPRRNYFYDDTSHIQVDPKTHLLSSGNAIAMDRTADIIAQTASMIATVVKPGPPSGTPPATPKPKPSKKTVQPFNVVFDPSDPAAYADAQSVINSCGFDMAVVPKPKTSPNPGGKETSSTLTPAEKVQGIVFRGLNSYTVTIKNLPNYSAAGLRENQVVMLPDKNEEFYLPYSRLAFVTKTTNVTFVDGTPQDFSETAPSPILGFLAIPKAIIAAVVPNPLNALSPKATPSQGVASPAPKAAAATPAAKTPSPSASATKVAKEE